MSKLSKTGAFPFTRSQPCLRPEQRRTIPSPQDVIDFFRTHERVSWNLTEFLEIPWQSIDVAQLTPADIYVVETTMLVESNNPDYVANLIEYFGADQDVCDFVMMWAIEEWKHYYALRDYLTKVQIALAARADHASTLQFEAIERSVHAALSEQVADVRESSIQNWGIPAQYLPVQVVASTTLQEFVTADFYRSHAKHTREPVLAKLETLLAKDETRHEMFYEQKTRDCLEAEPQQLPLVIDALKEFGMPGAYVLDDYGERREAMERAAFPTLAERNDAFVRVVSKISRIVGRENAVRIMSEGNYLSDGHDDPSRKKIRPETITRLLTRRLG